jgi:hypothetical protein
LLSESLSITGQKRLRRSAGSMGRYKPFQRTS